MRADARVLLNAHCLWHGFAFALFSLDGSAAISELNPCRRRWPTRHLEVIFSLIWFPRDLPRPFRCIHGMRNELTARDG